MTSDNRQESQLENLKYKIDSLSREVHKSEVALTNLAFMKDIANRKLPKQIILEILNNNNLLESIASRSYRHVNHFYKIVLVDNLNPTGYRLTLHLWEGNYNQELLEQELIHNHRFSLWSHILLGNMASEVFRESQEFSSSNKNLNRFIYTPSTRGNIHVCNFDKKAQLYKIKNSFYEQGKTYYLHFNTIHRIIMPRNNKKLCSFVLRGPRESDLIYTYNTFYPKRGTKSTVPMMQPHELKDKFYQILEDIQ